jgi:hypothetical protein
MGEIEKISQFIGDIYDAALDRNLWPAVLEQACAFVPGACSAILSQNPAADVERFCFSWGVDPEQAKSYLKTYMHMNPAGMSSTSCTEAWEVGSRAMVMPRDKLHAGPFYLAWAQPRGYCDAISEMLENSRTAQTALVILRNERRGIVDVEARRRMALMAPHFHRVVAIGNAIELYKLEAAALADTLDSIAATMLRAGPAQAPDACRRAPR